MASSRSGPVRVLEIWRISVVTARTGWLGSWAAAIVARTTEYNFGIDKTFLMRRRAQGRQRREEGGGNSQGRQAPAGRPRTPIPKLAGSHSTLSGSPSSNQDTCPAAIFCPGNVAQ